MSALDGVVIAIYIALLLGLSMWFSKRQHSLEDYYVGGRKLPWWAVAISIMATQSSATSFVGIPAFVALAPGGGLSWLQYELALPLAMIAVMALLIPFFRGLNLVSVYEYLELRFDRSTRLTISTVFLIGRSLATGVGVYASAVVLSVCMNIPIWACILIMGAFTIVYDMLGGIEAVVWSDVLQTFVLLTGLVICIVCAVMIVGGWDAVMAAQDAARLSSIRPGHGLGDNAPAPFWGFLIGGVFLYSSYYGADQSQTQRLLAAPSIRAAKYSLMFNGLARLPITLLYIALGLALSAVYYSNANQLQSLVHQDNINTLVPRFIAMYLPAGFRGLLFSALLAAAMSSLDSSLNSLSASTMRDFIEPRLRQRSGDNPEAQLLRWSRITTLIWGLAITGFAFVVGDIASTVVEGINMIPSLFYGPILAAFILGILSRRARGPGIIAGIVAGVLGNVLIWLFVPSIFWMWWNLIGFGITYVVALTLSIFLDPPQSDKIEKTTLNASMILGREKTWIKHYAVLLVYFMIMLLLAFNSQTFLS